ncbi:MAG: molybdopterin-dependent oxidoreductase, partial [Thermodesulfovibrionia bacterium]|nr:molybdopterin-dependent oxidoreductase [Thermodesulfovibrionia bacterium]
MVKLIYMVKPQKKYAMLINLDRCVGCFACQVTCKAEYNIPFGTFRCRVETYQSGGYPHIDKFFIPRLCNHCDNAPCIEACEENALYKNQDGVVMINNTDCTGCRICREKCPYNAIEISPVTGEVEKCDFCYSRRIIKGLLPVCVQSCMGKALLFGDIYDPESEIAAALKKTRIKVLSPEFSTSPSVYYAFKGETYDAPLKNFDIKERHSIRRITIKHTPDHAEGSPQLIHTSDAMCPSECGISVLVENGIARKIFGNPHSLINNGAFCAKGASGLQLTYSPHRIKTPLIRTGNRGEDKWKEISWEEAADFIAGKLIEIKQKFGPESVFLDCGDVTDREAYYRLFHAFGTPNTFDHGSICDPNRKWGQAIITGDERPLPDIQRPFLTRNDKGEMFLKDKHDIKLLLNIGVNPFVATRFNYMSGGIPAARENKCIYIVVDPAYTNSAAHADTWLPIIPGGDAALLAAMLYYIINNDSPHNPSSKYIDHDFLGKYTTGWWEFKEAFLAHTEKADPSNGLYFFTPEWAAEKTGISKDTIKKVAHMFGITKPASIEIGMHGTAHHTNGDVTSILMTALCIVTGNMDTPGGLIFINSQKPRKGGNTVGKEFLNKPVARKINGHDTKGVLSELHKDRYGDYPAAMKGVLTDLPRKIMDGISLKHGPFKGYTYPVKALIARAGNPVVTAGNTHDWIDALTSGEESGGHRLELMVFIDTHITVTGKYADIVLPEAGFLERMGLSDVYTMSPEVSIRDQVIKPLYKSRTPFEIMLTISEALSKKGDPDIRTEDFKGKYKNEEAFINKILGETPGFYNIGEPLPYPDLPEGCMITGTPDNPFAIMGKKTVKKGELLTVDWLRKHHGVAVWPASYHRYKNSDGSPSGIYPETASKKFEFRFSYLESINTKAGTNFPTTFYWSDCKWNPKNPLFKKISNEYP